MAEIEDRGARGRIERVETKASGRGGAVQLGGAVSFGAERYPTTTSPECAVLRITVNGASKVIGYFSLDGQYHAVGV